MKGGRFIQEIIASLNGYKSNHNGQRTSNVDWYLLFYNIKELFKNGWHNYFRRGGKKSSVKPRKITKKPTTDKNQIVKSKPKKQKINK